LRFDVALFVDLRDASLTDELSDTVDYGEVAERVAAVMRENMLARLARSSSVEVDRRRSHRYCPRGGQHLAFAVVAIADPNRYPSSSTSPTWASM